MNSALGTTIGLLAGGGFVFLGGVYGETLRYRQADRSARRARTDAIADRDFDFKRDTLVALSDALLKLDRDLGEMVLDTGVGSLDRRTGQHEAVRRQLNEVFALVARVQDPDLTARIDEYSNALGAVADSNEPLSNHEDRSRLLLKTFDECQNQMGLTLSKLTASRLGQPN